MDGLAYLGGVIDLTVVDSDSDQDTNQSQPSRSQIRDGITAAKHLSRKRSRDGSKEMATKSRGNVLAPMVLDLSSSPSKRDTHLLNTHGWRSDGQRRSLKRTINDILKDNAQQGLGRTDYVLETRSSEGDQIVAVQERIPVTTSTEGRTSFNALLAAAQRAEATPDVEDSNWRFDDDDVADSHVDDPSVAAEAAASQARDHHAATTSEDRDTQSSHSPLLHSTDERMSLPSSRESTLAPDLDSRRTPADGASGGVTKVTDSMAWTTSDLVTRLDSPVVPDTAPQHSPSHQALPRFCETTQSLPSRPGSPSLIVKTANRLLKRHNAEKRSMFLQNGTRTLNKHEHNPTVLHLRHTANGPSNRSSSNFEDESEFEELRSATPGPKRLPNSSQVDRPTLPLELIAERAQWANRAPSERGQALTNRERRKIVELRLFYNATFHEIAKWFPGRTHATICTTWNKQLERQLEPWLSPDEFEKYVPAVKASLNERGVTGVYESLNSDGILVAPRNHGGITFPSGSQPGTVLQKGRALPAELHRPQSARSLSQKMESSSNAIRRPRRSANQPQNYYAPPAWLLREDTDSSLPRSSSPEDMQQVQQLKQAFAPARHDTPDPQARRRVRRSRKEAPLPNPMPYLTFSERQGLKRGLSGCHWDSKRLSRWSGVPLHVSFSPSEMEEVSEAIHEILGGSSSIPQRTDHLTDRLRDASEGDHRQILWRIKEDEKLASRTVDDVEAFLTDLHNGHIERPGIKHYLGSHSPLAALIGTKSALLRHRELGINPKLAQTSLKDHVLSNLGPTMHFEKTSGDVTTLAWSANNEVFAAGSVALVDRDSMQYNLPNNLLLGNLETSEIEELAAHFISRERTERGPNSTYEMHVSQDPRLFTTVTAVDFSQTGNRMYSAGYDKTVRYWDINLQRTSLINTVSHGAPVDLLVVQPGTDRIIATGCQKAENSIRVIDCREDGPRTTALYSSDAAVKKPDARLFPSALRWGVHGLVNDYLLAGFASNRKEDMDGPETLGGVRLWDVSRGASIKVHPDTRTVFDVAWSIHGPQFAVASIVGNNRGDRNARSEVKIYDPKVDDRFTFLQSFQCPASDINDVVYCPYDANLISVGCTSGCVYVWDQRRPDSILHRLYHGEPLQPMQYDNIREREQLDVGVRFVAWSHTRSRFYSGSSDGIVACWDPYRATEDAKLKEVIQLDSGVMSGAFSPDYSKLLLGSANGRIDVLEVGNEDRRPCASMPLRKIDPPPADSNQSLPASNDPDSGVSCAKELINLKAVELRPMGAFPIRQAVKGPSYDSTGYHDMSMDAPILRLKADAFQTRLRNQLLSMDKCMIASCAEASKGSRITAEDAGDSGRSSDRIPHALRQTDSAAGGDRVIAGMAKCAGCGRPARPRAGDEEPTLCERCDFTCFRCAGAARLSSSRAHCIECPSCGAAWRVDILGYTLISEASEKPAPQYATGKRWRRQSKRWAKHISGLECAIELDSDEQAGMAPNPFDELALSPCREFRSAQYQHLEALHGRWGVEVDESFKSGRDV